MKVLAFDACLGAVSVAVRCVDGAGQATLTEARELRATGHAERLMPMMADVLARAGLDFGNLQRLAVTLGPGTFTGVRTGIAAARALRLSAGLEVVGATSLAVIAHGLLARPGGGIGRRSLLVAVDARRGRLYAQAFDGSALQPLTGPVEVTADEALELAGAGSLVLAGSGARAVADIAASRHRDVVIAAEAVEPSAADLADLASHLSPLRHVHPIYIRAPDAKPQTGMSLERAP